MAGTGPPHPARMRETQQLLEKSLDRGGPFTRQDALDAGWSSYALAQEVEHRTWARLEEGVFVARSWYDGLEARERHLVDVRARLLVRGSGWHAARRSAAIAHGLPLLGKLPAVPLLVRDRSAPSDRGYLRTERTNTLPESERAERDALAVTSLARTAVDLAREESFRAAVVAVDGALHAGLPVEEVVAVLDRCRTWPGAKRARRVLAHVDGRSESALESLSRAGFVEAGLPMPEPQVEVWCEGFFVARVDFLWRAYLVVGEADGRVKYARVEDLYEEKRREERLRDLGFEVVRWDWASAKHPERGLHAAIERALARGRLNTLAPGVRLRSTALGRADRAG